MRFCFEDFALDTSRQELSRHGLVMPASPQVLALLVHLIEHRDNVVTKQQLVESVWNCRIVSDAAVTTRINVLRELLGDNGREQRLIKTYPRRGFRFVGDARVEWHASPQPALARRDLPSIAVLAFANPLGDPAQAFFGDALAEEVLTELARLRWLLVIARNSSFIYRGRAVDVRQVGTELDVRYVLEGSAWHDNGRVRVTCRLIDATTALQIWSARYDRNLTDLFQVLDEIGEAVISEIGPAILDAERSRIARLPPDSLTAWEAYQRGVAYMLTPSIEGNVSARQSFQQAVSLKPDYSHGFDGWAWTHLVDASALGRMPVDEACDLSEPLVRRALQLNPDNTGARTRLALTFHLRGNNQAAIEETEAALATVANCADAFGAQGTALVFSGRPGEGRVAIEKFLRLSPRDPAKSIRLSQLAASYYFENDYENALRVARQTIRDYPDIPMAFRWMAAALGQLGRRAEGCRVIETLQMRHAASIAAYVSRPPRYFRLQDHEHLMEGLGKAGWRK
ncbi:MULTISPECIES: winged helix-turn-helix domain-containing tetratricopeptide repeat protein [Bradyrhizobium]|uniref:winged helix-turn-helix domain-containing tetratricopeptide repeat protein n=1 Tax=Bradyrhizobium TaxID=374 RepID=UPI001B8A2C35|nr:MULTISPECIES: winged helix-turn-helix domain-containing tetratricopeptide repeat protein [Bradyrhizobium]MBR0972725.1 winged helix-turn-helix domain-containing protein [Bradyrhizobium japonicum]